MKIALVLEDLLLGGTQRQALELATGLQDAGLSPELWTLTSGDQLSGLARERGLTVRILGRGPRVTPATLLRLAGQLLRSQPELLLLLTVLPNIWGRIVGRLCLQPHIIGACRGGGAPFRQHEKMLWPLASHHICNTQALKEVLAAQCRVPVSRITVIYNGIDTNVFYPPSTPPCGQTILSVGRLVPDKEQTTLIKAFAEIQPAFPKAVLRIVGDGPLHETLSELAGSLLAPGSCQLLPGRADIAPVYREANIFALSSAREGLPNVVLEAMATGLPVVGTAVGGLPEVVQEGTSGLLVPRGDHQAMARALASLLADVPRAQQYGRAGEKIIQKKFSLHACLTQHISLFSSLIPS